MELVDKLPGAVMEPCFLPRRLEVAVGQGKKPVSCFRPSLTGQGMEQACVRPHGGGIQVPSDVLKAISQKCLPCLDHKIPKLQNEMVSRRGCDLH